MKTTFLRLAVVVLFTPCCEVQLVDPADLSASFPDLRATADLRVSPVDLRMSSSDLGGCAGVIYRLTNGPYAAVPGSATIASDTCRTGITGPQLESVRQLQNDFTGNITLYATNGSTVIGAGPVRCNKGVLSSGPTVVSDGVCRYTVNYSVDFTVTAGNAFTATVTQSRSESSSETGMFCVQPATCALRFTVSHKS